MTVFQEMVVESILPNQIKWSWYHSLQKTNVLSDEIKICYIFEYQSNDNWAFHFLTLCLPRCANLHVRKRATFADLHCYTHTYCSFVLLNEAITIVFGSNCLHASLIWLFGILHYDLQVKRYCQLNIVLLNVAPIPVCPKIMWHTGGFVLGKQSVKGHPV